MAEAVAAGQGPRVLLSSSAIGFYGDTGDRLTDETGASGEGFLARCAGSGRPRPQRGAGRRAVAHLRTGIVLSGDGGIVGKQLLLFKAGLGAPLGSGRQWTSWISLQDEVAAIRHLLTADVEGPVNLVGPAPVTNREFTKASVGRAPADPAGPRPWRRPAPRRRRLR
jgi:NAD dependent epimerase/dehydratase family enzyme